MKLTTERLELRRYRETEDDAAFVHKLYNHPKVAAFLSREPMTAAKAAEYVARQATAADGEPQRWHGFAISDLADNRLIGEAGLFLGSAAELKGDLGYMLDPDYHGRGYATEAASALLKYAFSDLKLHRITAGCDAGNAASFRVMERLGMRREAHFLQSSLVNGVWRDSFAYAVLRDEWLARQAAQATR